MALFVVLLLTQTCNSQFSWRPIFKLNKGEAKYHGQGNPKTYYTDGTATYSTQSAEDEYSYNIPTDIETDNFRSLLINQWKTNSIQVDQVRIDFYGSENKYVFFDATSVSGNEWYDWLRTDYVINSSWTDLTSSTTPCWSDAHGIQTSHWSDRFFLIWKEAPGCWGDKAWFTVSTATHCDTEWNEGTDKPGIFYSPGTTLTTWDNSVIEGDTMIISIYADLTFSPTPAPTWHPTISTPAPTECITEPTTQIDTTTLTGWTQVSEGDTIVPGVTFAIISDYPMKCYASNNPCIEINGIDPWQTSEEMYIEYEIDTSDYDDITISIELATSSIDNSDYCFIDTLCDGTNKVRTKFHDGINNNNINPTHYSNCSTIDTSSCTTLQLRIGGYLSGYGDHIYLSEVKYTYTLGATTDPTNTPSISPTQPPSISPTQPPSNSPTQSPSISPTQPPSISPTQPPSYSPTQPPSTSPTQPPSISPTQPPSISPTQPPSIIPSISPTNPPSISPTQPPSNSPTQPPSFSPSIAPTQPPSISPTQPPSIAPTQPPSNMPSISPTQPPSISPTQPPSNAPSISPTQPPSIAPTQPPSIAPTQPPSIVPSISPTQPPSIAPTQPPSISPTQPPSNMPSLAPTQPPSISPTQPPSNMPSNAPSINPTPAPTDIPTYIPTIEPTYIPTFIPTTNPINFPTPDPTKSPTYEPTYVPTNIPTYIPTYIPTNIPTYIPTTIPSSNPTTQPTLIPTFIPTHNPINFPTLIPTYQPTFIPTYQPTYEPTFVPTYIPTNIPTNIPTYIPTNIPSNIPTFIPTIIPTFIPTISPTKIPSKTPSITPTKIPSKIPSITPTKIPSKIPSISPSKIPSQMPSISPTISNAVTTNYSISIECGDDNDQGDNNNNGESNGCDEEAIQQQIVDILNAQPDVIITSTDIIRTDDEIIIKLSIQTPDDKVLTPDTIEKVIDKEIDDDIEIEVENDNDKNTIDKSNNPLMDIITNPLILIILAVFLCLVIFFCVFCAYFYGKQKAQKRIIQDQGIQLQRIISLSGDLSAGIVDESGGGPITNPGGEGDGINNNAHITVPGSTASATNVSPGTIDGVPGTTDGYENVVPGDGNENDEKQLIANNMQMDSVKYLTRIATIKQLPESDDEKNDGEIEDNDAKLDEIYDEVVSDNGNNVNSDGDTDEENEMMYNGTMENEDIVLVTPGNDNGDTGTDEDNEMNSLYKKSDHKTRGQ